MVEHAVELHHAGARQGDLHVLLVPGLQLHADALGVDGEGVRHGALVLDMDGQLLRGRAREDRRVEVVAGVVVLLDVHGGHPRHVRGPVIVGGVVPDRDGATARGAATGARGGRGR